MRRVSGVKTYTSLANTVRNTFSNLLLRVQILFAFVKHSDSGPTMNNNG